MEKYNIELTDTFGGEANYSWVRRYSLLVPSIDPDTATTSVMADIRKRNSHARMVIRKAKALAGLTGIRCRKDSFGHDLLALYPFGSCTVLFITYDGEA